MPTHIFSRYPLPKSLPSGEGLAFTASSEEEWCFANAKLELFYFLAEGIDPKASVRIDADHDHAERGVEDRLSDVRGIGSSLLACDHALVRVVVRLDSYPAARSPEREGRGVADPLVAVIEVLDRIVDDSVFLPRIRLGGIFTTSQREVRRIVLDRKIDEPDGLSQRVVKELRVVGGDLVVTTDEGNRVNLRRTREVVRVLVEGESVGSVD